MLYPICEHSAYQADLECAWEQTSDWRVDAREKIEEIGQRDAQLASRLSTMIMNYRGTCDEREFLSRHGITPLASYPSGGLLGGNSSTIARNGEEVVRMVVKGAVKGVARVVHLYTTGDESKAKEKQAAIERGESACSFLITLSDGTEIKGKYTGKTHLKKTRTRCGTIQFLYIPYGEGEFVCDYLTYTGHFYDGKFHTVGASVAVCDYASKEQQYEGRFVNGKRDGYGKLFYKNSSGVSYVMYEGDWENDRPKEGRYLDADGNTITLFVDGQIVSELDYKDIEWEWEYWLSDLIPFLGRYFQPTFENLVARVRQMRDDKQAREVTECVMKYTCLFGTDIGDDGPSTAEPHRERATERADKKSKRF